MSTGPTYITWRTYPFYWKCSMAKLLDANETSKMKDSILKWYDTNYASNFFHCLMFCHLFKAIFLWKQVNILALTYIFIYEDIKLMPDYVIVNAAVKTKEAHSWQIYSGLESKNNHVNLLDYVFK